MNSIKIKIADVDVLVTASEKNIQLNDLPTEKFESVWNQVVADYSGYEVFFCFNSERMELGQKVPIEQLTKIKAAIIDDMLNFKLHSDRFTMVELENGLEVELLTETEFAEFATFHDHHNPDMFWTSDRIKKRRNIWQIHTLKKNKQLEGYVMTMITNKNTEIFAIKADCNATFKALLTTTCQNAFAIGKKEILYMIEKGALTSHQQIAMNLGFKETGFYQGFQVYL